MRHISLADFHGNPNIGLYAFATDEVAIVGRELPDKLAEQIGKTLSVPVVRTNIAGCPLIGIFITGNKHGIVVPSLIFPTEKRILEKAKVKFTVIDTDITALGNNLLVNDERGLANPEFGPKTIKAIEAALKITLEEGTIGKMPVIGSLAAISKSGGLVHPDATKDEIARIESLTKGEVLPATINFGNPYVRSGLIANNNGVVVGSKSTGVEVSDAEMAFGIVHR